MHHIFLSSGRRSIYNSLSRSYHLHLISHQQMRNESLICHHVGNFFFPLELSFQVWHFLQVLMGRFSLQVFIRSVAIVFVHCITQHPFKMACKELEVKTPSFPSSHKVHQRDFWRDHLLLKLKFCLFHSIWLVSKDIICNNLDFHVSSVRSCLLSFSEHVLLLPWWNFLSLRDGL